jgi:hypothetical protein
MSGHAAPGKNRLTNCWHDCRRIQTEMGALSGQTVNGWPTIKKDGQAPKVKGLSKLSRCIVKRLRSDLESFFEKSKSRNPRSEQTKHIMDALLILGKDGLAGEQEFKGMTNTLSNYLKQGYTGPKKSLNFPQRYRGQFKKIEWLYDLHWFKEGGSYRMTSLPLVVECEWAYKRKGDEDKDDYSAVKWDFQKLLVANAKLRLMVFRKRTGTDIKSKKKPEMRIGSWPSIFRRR